jgi:hypothetical protein
MSFPKVTTAYVPPDFMAYSLAQVMLYMHGTRGTRPEGWPELTDWQCLDDRGGSGCYRLLFPELNQRQVRWMLSPRKIGLRAAIDITIEDA